MTDYREATPRDFSCIAQLSAQSFGKQHDSGLLDSVCPSAGRAGADADYQHGGKPEVL